MIDSNETIMYENGRDAGYAEGFEDGLNVKLETIDHHEAIVLYFNFETTDMDEMCRLHKHIENKFPDNTVVLVPDRISLESWSKDELENYISMISEIIENM